MKTTTLPCAITNRNQDFKINFAKWMSPAVALFVGLGSAYAADLVWIGGTGNWNAADNWNPAQVPTNTDNAIITNVGTYTVTVPAGTTATAGSIMVGGASGTQTLAIDRATLTVSASSVVNASGKLELLVSQSALTGAGDLTVNGTLNWVNGSISGAGTLNIGGGGLLAIGSAGVTLARTLNNSGTAIWAGGNVTATSGAAGLNNLPGGTFEITADGHFNGSATTPISNSGLFRQAAGAASTIVTAPFNNSGIVEVQAATLSLNLGGASSGIISNAPGATLQFSGGNHALTAASLVTGAGVTSLSGNATTLTASGTFAGGSTLSVTAGTATLAPTCDVTGATLNISGANSVVNFNSSGSVGAVNLAGGTLGGTSPINVTGLLSLSGGTITNALVTANGGLNIGGGVTLNGGKLINPGSAVWSAGNLTGANGAVFSNLLGATFFNTFDGNAASGAGATPIFVNQGIFAKTNGTAALGTTSIDFQFFNIGTVEVRTNTLRYGINQQTDGLTLLDGGNLSAQAQPLQFLGGSLMGTGLVTVANVQNVINSSSVSPGLPLGELDIAGNYQQTASGVLNIDLGGYSPGTTYDLVTVAVGGAGGVATLGGTLNVSLAGGFSPTNGATFTFLTANSRVGAFANFNFPSNDIGMQISYDLTSAKVTVSNLKPVVANPMVDPAPIIYGTTFNFQFAADTFSDADSDPLSYTASGMPAGITFDGATRTFSGAPTETGVFPVTLFAHDGGTPSLTATNTFSITVNPAPLAVSADPQIKTYGALDPDLTFAVSGLQFTDSLATVLTGALARAAGEGVAGGPYAITQGTLAANGNYTIHFTGSTLTITPATLTVVAQPKTKSYGAVDPALTFIAGGLQFTDAPATVLTGALARAAGEGVAGGPYVITQGTLAANENYTINFTGSAFTITPAALSVTADDKNKTYGAADPPFTVTNAGFVNSENQTVLGGTLAFDRAPGESVGSYLITPGGITSTNYTITFNTGNLTISKAALSVTADSLTKTYGDADPALTFTVGALQFSDTSTSVLTGALIRAPGESVAGNPYAISQGTLAANGNYSISFTGSVLNIAPRAMTVTATDQIKTYGTTLTLNGTTDFTSSGLQNSESIGAVTLTANGSPAGTAPTAAAGSYAITPSVATGGTFNSTNYAITYAAGTLTVNKAALSVTADVKTKTLGTADPVFTVSYAGFVNAETPAVLNGTLTFSRTPGESVGNYLITPNGLSSGNYVITFNTGTLTITAPAPLILPLTLAGTNVVISWNSVSNGAYRVQYQPVLDATNWTDLPGDVIATNGIASKTDIHTSTNRFYRVRVLP